MHTADTIDALYPHTAQFAEALGYFPEESGEHHPDILLNWGAYWGGRWELPGRLGALNGLLRKAMRADIAQAANDARPHGAIWPAERVTPLTAAELAHVRTYRYAPVWHVRKP